MALGKQPLSRRVSTFVCAAVFVPRTLIFYCIFAITVQNQAERSLILQVKGHKSHKLNATEPKKEERNGRDEITEAQQVFTFKLADLWAQPAVCHSVVKGKYTTEKRG